MYIFHYNIVYKQCYLKSKLKCNLISIWALSVFRLDLYLNINKPNPEPNRFGFGPI